jgi:hypothetical protein
VPKQSIKFGFEIRADAAITDKAFAATELGFCTFITASLAP